MDPATLAKDAHARFMHRDDDTYARPLVGTEASLEGLSDDDAHAFVASCYGPAAAEVVVAGDVEPSEGRSRRGGSLRKLGTPRRRRSPSPGSVPEGGSASSTSWTGRARSSPRSARATRASPGLYRTTWRSRS